MFESLLRDPAASRFCFAIYQHRSKDSVSNSTLVRHKISRGGHATRCEKEIYFRSECPSHCHGHTVSLRYYLPQQWKYYGINPYSTYSLSLLSFVRWYWERLREGQNSRCTLVGIVVAVLSLQYDVMVGTGGQCCGQIVGFGAVRRNIHADETFHGHVYDSIFREAWWECPGGIFLLQVGPFPGA